MIYIKKLFLFLFLINISFPNQIDYSKVNFNDFGFSLFKQINLKNDSDFSISPISVAYALMMTNSGASEQTSDEILEILNLSDSDLNESLNHLKFYIADSKNNNLTFGNSIWIQSDKCYMPNQNYINEISSIFDGKVSFVNFYDDRLSIIDSINIWVNGMTYGLIKDIVSEQDVKRTTKQVLVNTLHFKSDWQFVFDTSKTKMETFYSYNENLMIPMMNKKNRYSHYKGESFHLLDIPYEKHNISMLFLLPNDNVSLDSLIENINIHKLLPVETFHISYFQIMF